MYEEFLVEEVKPRKFLQAVTIFLFRRKSEIHVFPQIAVCVFPLHFIVKILITAV